jgi:2'-5' RNA ligase
MRLFFALWPDDATRAALASAAALLNLRDGQPVQHADLHMTLAFLGEVPEARVAALCAMAAELRASSFELGISAAGWWRRSRVAWLAPASVPAALTGLAMALQQGAGIAVEGAASYRPHVTVARGVRCPPGLLSSFSVPWAVRDFVLVSSNSASTGPRYQTLAQWPLASTCVD